MISLADEIRCFCPESGSVNTYANYQRSEKDSLRNDATRIQGNTGHCPCKHNQIFKDQTSDYQADSKENFGQTTDYNDIRYARWTNLRLLRKNEF